MTLLDRLDELAGRAANALVAAACLLLFVMMSIICADVFLRNVQIASMPRGLAIANDVSEASIYLITLLCAPWLLRYGRHIRIDVILRMLPDRVGWLVEWVADVLVLVSCAFMVWYGYVVTARSYWSDAMMVKTLITPEWWILAPLPAIFLLLAIEVCFRIRRLSRGPQRVRDEQVSAS